MVGELLPVENQLLPEAGIHLVVQFHLNSSLSTNLDSNA